MSISAAVASILASGITQFLKTKKPDNISEEERKKRSKILKAISAFFSVVLTAAGAWLLGDAIDVASLEGQLETLSAAVLALIGPQGWYKMFKN